MATTGNKELADDGLTCARTYSESTDAKEIHVVHVVAL